MNVLCQFERQDNGSYACSVCGRRAPAFALPPRAHCGLTPRFQPQSPPPPDGPGTRLKTLLRDWLGIEASPTCSCNAMAAKMNTLGPDWCEGEGMVEILNVMRDEHAKRWADGRTVLPWTDFAAKRLVLLACRQARASV
jgi:hypothetical protein